MTEGSPGGGSDNGQEDGLPAAGGPTVSHSESGKTRRHHRVNWRRVSVWFLIVAASLFLVVSSLNVFVKREALDTTNFANSSGQLLENPQVRTQLSTYLVDQLYQHVDVAGELRKVLPKQVQGVAAPAAAALREYGQRAAFTVLGTSAVNAAFKNSVARAHAAFLKIVYSDPGRAKAVYLRLRPMVLTVASRMGLEKQAAKALPADAGKLTLFKESQISTIRTAIDAIRALSIYLALLIVFMLGLAIYLARGWRRRALIYSGFGVLVAGVLVLVARELAQTALLDAVVGSTPVRPAAAASYAILTDLLGTIAWTIIEIGALAIVLGWLSGPSRPAHALRRLFAPGLVRYPAIAWGIVTFLVMLLFMLVPITDATKVIHRIVVIILLAAGTEMLRRITKKEHPDGGWTFNDVHLPHRHAVEQAGGHGSRYDALDHVTRLRKQGVLTAEEADREKARILA